MRKPQVSIKLKKAGAVAAASAGSKTGIASVSDNRSESKSLAALQAAVAQRSVDVNISIEDDSLAKAEIDQVTVTGREYAAPSQIMGHKSPGDHRSHVLSWDLEKMKWEQEFLGRTVGDLMDSLSMGKTSSLQEVQDTYAAVIDQEAQQMPLFYGSGTENMAGGAEYRHKKQQYEMSRGLRDDDDSDFDEDEHAVYRQEFLDASLDFPSDKLLGGKKKAKKFKEQQTTKAMGLIEEVYDTEFEDES